MKQKRNLLIPLVLLLALLLTACTNQKAAPGSTVFSPTPGTQTDANTNTTDQADATTTQSRTPNLAETYPIKDILSIGKYKGLSIPVTKLTVTDKEIDTRLYQDLEDYAVETEGTTATLYDFLNIDFEGKLDGIPFENGTAQDFDMFLGSGNFIPGFEEGMIGQALGETKDIFLSVPSTYRNETIAGKDVVFTITINTIRRIPELTDSFLMENTDFDTLSAYRESIRSSLQEQYDANTESIFEQDLVAKIIEGTSFHMDLSKEIDNYTNNLTAMYEYNAQQYGVSLDVFVTAIFGMSVAEFQKELPITAEQVIKRYYCLLAIADAEGMTVTDEEYEQQAMQMMVDYGYTTRDELEADYSRKSIENSILSDRAFQLVKESAIRE